MNHLITTTSGNPVPVTPKSRKRRRLLGILMDRSTSMKEMVSEVEAGVADFLEEQAGVDRELEAKGDKARTRVLLAQFGSEYSPVYGPVKLKDAPEYRMEVRGMTALYDSIGSIVEAMRADVAVETRRGRKPDAVTLVIMTDGMENHSKRLRTAAQVKALIEACREEGWEVLFLAANQDAVLTGQSLGVAGEMSLTYNASTASGGVLRSAGAAVAASYASGTSLSFSKADRDAVQ